MCLFFKISFFKKFNIITFNYCSVDYSFQKIAFYKCTVHTLKALVPFSDYFNVNSSFDIFQSVSCTKLNSILFNLSKHIVELIDSAK